MNERNMIPLTGVVRGRLGRVLTAALLSTGALAFPSSSLASAAQDFFAGAKWIAAPAASELSAAAPRFTTTFTVPADGPAPIAICGLGQYVATLNGRPLGRGDEFNLPGWTHSRKTCFYHVVRPELKAGVVNTLVVTLGHGMYDVPDPGRGFYTKFTGSEGGLKLLVGGVVRSATNGWTVSASEVVRTHVYCGDDIDRTADLSRTVAPVAAEAPTGVLREAPFVCRLQETVKPARVMRVSDEELTVDFAQNAAYVPTVTAKGPRGSRIEISFAERPLPEGAVQVPESWFGYNRRAVRCLFTLAGTGEAETFTPPFFYYGFRYMRVKELPPAAGGARARLAGADARVVMADVPRAGSFRCSNDLFNKIHDLCWWSQRSNMQSVFTDCPHREKLGWQEQNNVHSEQIRWGWQAGVMYAKTCLDLADAQLPNGMCPDIAPEYTVFRGGFRHSIEWGSSMIQIPWQQLEWTGDDALIRTYYPNMVAYHRYIRATSQRPGAAFITPGGLGDWYENTSYGRRNRRLTPIDLPATVYYFMNANILAACADRLGKAADAAEFREEAGRIRAAFNAKWWNPATRSYAGNTQTANAMALGGGLVDPAMASSVVSNIVADIRAHGNALATGEIGYPFLLKVLSDHGYDELIYDMTCVTDKPGYGNMILKGNTTCHEAWDSRPSSSFNHFMMADIVTWFYGTLGGIKRTSHAFKTFDVAPFFPKGIDWVEARHAAPSGEIAVAWRRSGTTIAVDVTVPAGTCARVRLPGRPVETQRPGTCRYTVTVR